MLKFLSGWIVGLATIPVLVIAGVTFGAGHLGDTLQRHAESSVESRIVKALESDDLETYRVCLTGYFAERGNAVEAVTSCAWELAEWKASPTFATEWRKLTTTDSDVRAILEAYQMAMAD